uniref:Uncharacterized protein n=1 Tax=Eutreptiella gymnastica TaxID=73025 RepID=A0A7S4CKE9_9EUGL
MKVAEVSGLHVGRPLRTCCAGVHRAVLVEIKKKNRNCDTPSRLNQKGPKLHPTHLSPDCTPSHPHLVSKVRKTCGPAPEAPEKLLAVEVAREALAPLPTGTFGY